MDKDKYARLFLSEAQEILGELNNVLVGLEKKPDDMPLINELFRLSHTLKSMAQSMGYETVSTLAHAMEDGLALLRKGQYKAEKNFMDLLFQCLDTLGELVNDIKTGETVQKDITHLVTAFARLSNKETEEKTEHEKKPVKEDKDNNIHQPRSLNQTQSVRVPLDQLDSLMEITGEMVINRIRLARVASRIENHDLEESVSQMTRLTSQLQDQMMQVRLVPLDYLFAPYTRMVRDMAAKENKEVDLIINGSDIGMDRSIQNEINQPLLHLLKNAVIHGIELPEKREKAKKARRGSITITARRQRNFISIEVSDDGVGMDLDEIRTFAQQKGIITKEELSTLTSQETIMLATEPGYTGTSRVSREAGRGVGLNASRTKAESLGGTFDIRTVLGKETTISIKLPQTMSIIQAMLVGIADETYCIPLSFISETIKISPAQIKSIENNEVISHRERVLPLVRLTEKFGFADFNGSSKKTDDLSPASDIPVVVVEMGSRWAGLAVNHLLGQQEVVIKPLTGILSEIKGASGATILGTGKVSLVVDVGTLI